MIVRHKLAVNLLSPFSPSLCCVARLASQSPANPVCVGSNKITYSPWLQLSSVRTTKCRHTESIWQLAWRRRSMCRQRALSRQRRWRTTIFHQYSSKLHCVREPIPGDTLNWRSS